ncbi:MULTISPECIES: DUF2865 domain-containing protein [Bradyrhizobium]|jgi:hypothetical protein|uniref:DUF2865 domain-containing protein n=2 Tax=Bradyrhizobium TaxID=374 RepID=A0ABY0PWP1_9BRAD|nr:MULTISPECIES: DUF2865 domain-containing protein [Bradyrhizobium]SDJ07833.1 Protein of unknown function [Bradyrhizobium ottawaense]SEC95507.1 Protein of unknown function [Bradyrhizobium lablabi]SHL02615.1 Protein of unknown function [Bradyrhizobium lablabi]
MAVRTGRLAALGAAALLCASALASAAQAQDFFSALFGGMGRRAPQPYVSMPFANEDGSIPAPRSEMRPRYAGGGGGQAYCVRTCDGRYFPITASDNQSRAASCNSFCPASETRVVYGSNIDSAATDNGKPYSELPNAFRYRNEIVAGCTCNGKDQIGLAPVKIENDPTLRKGDIVAGENGLLVAGRSADRRGAALNFSPASERVRAKYERMPVVASE